MTPQRSKVAGPPQVEWPDIFNNRIRFRNFFSDARFFIGYDWVPPIDYLSQVWWESAAWHDAARSVLAIHRWHRSIANTPRRCNSSWTEATSMFCRRTRTRTDASRTAETGDSFILYSRGRKFQDDGGKSLADPNHWHERWGNPSS